MDSEKGTCLENQKRKHRLHTNIPVEVDSIKMGIIQIRLKIHF